MKKLFLSLMFLSGFAVASSEIKRSSEEQERLEALCERISRARRCYISHRIIENLSRPKFVQWSKEAGHEEKYCKYMKRFQQELRNLNCDEVGIEETQFRALNKEFKLLFPEVGLNFLWDQNIKYTEQRDIELDRSLEKSEVK